MFCLESVKSCRVVDKLTSDLKNEGINGNLIRELESDIEKKEWEECKYLLEMVVLNNEKD
ncbi:hypothetical protein Hdeb2414_s0002g00079011 [Helianthus debilis subsp. tardiflorus]